MPIISIDRLSADNAAVGGWQTRVDVSLLLVTVDRHVLLPKDLVDLVPKTHLMTETEWRSIGVQQSRGWVHYMIHEPGMCDIGSTT